MKPLYKIRRKSSGEFLRKASGGYVRRWDEEGTSWTQQAVRQVLTGLHGMERVGLEVVEVEQIPRRELTVDYVLTMKEVRK